MDSIEQPGFMNRLVSGFKDKTVRLAEEKLRKVVGAPESPEESILGFVASAVTAGASRLEIRVETNDLILTHDGKMLHPTEVTGLPRGHNVHRELSRALRLQISGSEDKVELQFLSPLGMHRISYHSKGESAVSNADLGDLNLAKMTTRIILKGSGNYRRVNQAMGNELPEVSLIRRRCFLAPLDLQISGRPLTPYAHLPASLVTGSNFHRDPAWAMPALPSLPVLGASINLAQLAPNLACVKSGICGVATNAGEAGWYRTTSGVAKPLSEVAWPTRTWGFVVIDENADLQLLSQDIAVLTACLTNELYLTLSKHTTSTAVSEESLSYLEQQRGTLLSMGHAAVDIDKTFLNLRQTMVPSSDPRVLSSRLELASSLESQGDIDQAHQQYAEVLPVWESEALNHFDKYRFEEGASLWQKALLVHEKLGTDPLEIAAKHLKLAEIGREQRLGFAEASYRRALTIYRSLPTPPGPLLLQGLLGLGDVLKRTRVLTESLRYAEEAEKLQLELSGGNETKDLVPILKLQAEVHDLMGDYSRSTDLEQRALLLKYRR